MSNTLAPVEQSIARIRRGVSVTEFNRLIKRLDLTNKEAAKVFTIPTRTLSRRLKAKERFDSSESERIVRVERVLEQAVALFDEDETAAKHWLSTPNRALGDASPLEYLDTDLGARIVENLIGRLEYGVYS